MLPRSLLTIFAGICLSSAQQFQQYYQPQQQQFSQFWQPQYDQQQPQFQQPQFQQQSQFLPQQQQLQFSPQQQQPQFPPPQQQFQAPPVQYQQQLPQSQPTQFNQPPVYQPQFQPQPTPAQFQSQPAPEQFQPQQPIQYQPQTNFAPQPTIQQQFQPQPNYQPVNQSPRVPPPTPQQFQQPPPVFQQQNVREQPTIFEQTFKASSSTRSLPISTEKVPFKPVQQPPPPPPSVQVQQPQIFQIAGPPPPQKFVPYIADIFNAGSDSKPPVITVISPDSRLPPGTYIAEEIVVDGNHPSFIENIKKFQPTIVNVPPRQPQTQPKSSFVPPPQAKLKIPEISAVHQQRPRPPPSPSVQTRPQPQPQPQPQFQPQPQLPPQPRPTPKKVAAPPPTVSGVKTANDVFLGCCKKRSVHKSCERICNFDILSKKTLTGMFLGTDPCPQSHGLDLLQCGASNDDHTQCCIENGVERTSAGKKCLGFCNMRPGVTFQADISMLPCWGVLNDIKDCFKAFIEEKL